MYKSQEINAQELEDFNTAKCTLWEALCMLEMIKDNLLANEDTINIDTALRGVVKMIDDSVTRLEEI
ncbi:TPA: hypothetical protein ACU207_000980 [Mannheimia haemolytica]|uniref:hypothetical protein n=1 Tax=Mannheimia haemolytica TaxID=75985 RepID=UPI001AD9C6ED|nr:hypothetical protein [Mannheimia haemolytica]MEE3700293.1 hypothetical protein [Mannheimia haemolytica]UQX70297.1 hypothetical protein M3705_02120 [Mannheimia haemolytica]HDL1261434.1 hypothetical protein [Mannheimia haemolytica]